MASIFTLGAVVVNFGITAEVIGHKEDGSLVLQSLDRGDKWVADPARCQAQAYAAVWPHPAALTMMVAGR